MIRISILLLVYIFPSLCTAETCAKSPQEFKREVLPILFSSKEKPVSLAASMDFDAISRRALSKKTMTTISEENFNEFKNTLETLLMAGFLKKLSTFEKPNLEYSFVNVNHFNIGGEVSSGNSLSELSLEVHKGQEGCWKIVDIVIDEVSMVDNYREQFQSIISKHDFATLLTKMKTKLKTLRS